MAHAHHDSGTTVVTDRDGLSGALIAIIAAVVVAFLIWLFAFSGVVFDRDTGGGGQTTNIEQQNTDTGTTGNTSSEPSPASS